MAYVWHYEGKCELPTDIPAGMLDEWEQTLKAEQARIYSGLTTKIPSEALFKDRIADASSDQYEAFLATVGALWDKDMITTKQRVKLNRVYADWLAGVEASFAPTGYFGDRVTSKKNKFKLVRYVLGAVGYKPDPSDPYGVWNPAVMAVLLLRGDTRCLRYLDANDSFAGTLETTVEARKGALITPSLIAEMVQAIVMAKFADEGGLTTIRDTILTNANTRLADILAVAVISPYTVVLSLSWDDPSAHVMVTAELTSKV